MHYRNHIAGFAHIACPLHQLTKKHTRFEWGELHEAAFLELKKRLVTAPVLSTPQDEGEFILDTDASDHTIGGVLQQNQNGSIKVIAYASRCLNKAEISYSVTKKELLAVIFGLKKWRQFLLARHIIIRTDHAALTQLMRTPEPLGQQARWLDILSEFNFTIMYRPGTSHRNGDALSRRPCDGVHCSLCVGTPSSHEPVSVDFEHHTTDGTTTELSCSEGHVQRIHTRCTSTKKNRPTAGSDEQYGGETETITVDPSATNLAILAIQNIAMEQKKDNALSHIRRTLTETATKPAWESVAGHAEETRSYWAQMESFVIQNDVLYRKFCKDNGELEYMQVIVPLSLRQEFMSQCHGGFVGGHFGIRRTQGQVQRRGYWVGWRNDVERFCKRCSTCAQVYRGRPPRQAELKPLEANGPMDRVHLDLCGPFVSSHGCSWIMMCVDAYSRYLVAVPLANKSAQAVAEKFMTHIIYRFGMCREILTDQGLEFQNSVLKTVCSRLSIHQMRTSTYRPNCNGKVERANRSLHNLMAKVVSDTQRDWVKHLPACVLAYNMSRSEATSYTPYFLMHAREALCPLDLLLEVPEVRDAVGTNEFAEKLICRMRSAFEVVSVHTKKQVTRMKRNYDKRVKPQEFQEGQYVWYYYPRHYLHRTPKWSRFYTGPFRIVRVLNGANVLIQKSPRGKTIIAHIDKLRPYFGEVPQCWINREAPRVETGCADAAEAGLHH